MSQREEKTGSFTARDGRGYIYEIEVFRTSIRAGSGEAEGPQAMRTTDGRAVVRVSQGVYDIEGGTSVRL